MHPENPYAAENAFDVARLCREDDNLAKIVSWKFGEKIPKIDFEEANVLCAVTEAAMRLDFGVKLKVRSDRLCPRLPNRLNYIAWLNELLQGSCYKEVVEFNTAKNDLRKQKRRRVEGADSVRILDIGTGAYCIYPLLGCALHDDWEFTATDIDAESLKHAKRIITEKRNNEQVRCRFGSGSLNFNRRIKLVQRTADEALIPIDGDYEDVLYHAIMCNPPFYSSKEEMQEKANLKFQKRTEATQGTANEMICNGGEVAFVERIVKESEQLKRRIAWFTCMLGKRQSVDEVVTVLQGRGIDNFHLTEFIQGQTKRWAIAWTFWQFRLPQSLTRLSRSMQELEEKSSICNSAKQTSRINRSGNVEDLTQTLHAHLIEKKFHLRLRQGGDQSVLYVFALCDTWSRKARRQAAREERDSSHHASGPLPTMGMQIKIIPSATNCVLESFWIYGLDRQLFDSMFISILRPWAMASN